MDSLSFSKIKAFSSTQLNLKTGIWWGILFICLFYSAYALYMGLLAVFAQVGFVNDAPTRGSVGSFIIHSLAGSTILVTGILQFNRHLLRYQRKLHRTLGKIYVGAVWVSSLSGLGATLFFDVPPAAKIILSSIAIAWFGATTLAFVYARQHQLKKHKNWMVRSFAVSLFFVTFSFWVPMLTSTALPFAISYPGAIVLSGSLNLLVAEWWIRSQTFQAV